MYGRYECRLLHLNINGLSNKLAEVSNLIEDREIDIMGLCETRLLE